MPGNLFSADVGFPDLSGKQSTDEKLRAVQDYLYILLETLRWTLRNLSPENFNTQELDNWAQTLETKTVLTDTMIADELYAGFGAIADLTVDELRTDWQKARRYLDGDTGPLDYIHVHDEVIDFRSGTVRYADGAPLTEQLHRGGRCWYWRDADMTQMTSEETAYPVIVYQYDELLKGSIRFEDYTPPGTNAVTKVPVFVLGAGHGNASDPARGRGFLRKGTRSFDVWLHNAAGEDRGIFIGEDYTDLAGLRKTTAMDFSGWDEGHFTETIDGGLGSRYTVSFDEDERPVRITDAAGHATEVRWE